MTTDTLTTPAIDPMADPAFIATRDESDALIRAALADLEAAEADKLAASVKAAQCGLTFGEYLHAQRTFFKSVNLTSAAWIEHAETVTGRKRAMLYRYVQAWTALQSLGEQTRKTVRETFADVEAVGLLSQVPKASVPSFVSGLTDTSRSAVKAAIREKGWGKPKADTSGDGVATDPDAVTPEAVSAKAAQVTEAVSQAVENLADPFELLALGASLVGGPLAAITASAILSLRPSDS